MGRAIDMEKDIDVLKREVEEIKQILNDILNEVKEDVKKETGLEIVSKHQGADNFRKYLEENTEICNYLFSKFRNALTIKS